MHILAGRTRLIHIRPCFLIENQTYWNMNGKGKTVSVSP